MNSVVAASPAPAARPRALAPGVLLLGGTLALLWFILCRDLSLEWSSNEQYSYGWFVPFFAAFLFWLRLEDAPHLRGGCRLLVSGSSSASGIGSSPNNQEQITNNAPLAAASAEVAPPATNNQQLITIGAIIALAMIAPIRLFEVANPDWRPLSWVHALAVVGLTLLAIGYWRGWPAVKHFAFPVAFILVAVPWLTPIEAPLVRGLMRLVATVATETLTLCGIPAQLEGSLIRVSNGVVGVNEACSGVRSLQTSLMIGLLFGELKRLTIARRVFLVAAALTIALVANFGRAFFLVWIAATRNLAAVEGWHDIAGYAIVGAVFVGTVAIAAWLARSRRSEDGGQRSEGGRGNSPAIRSALLPFSVSVFSVSAFVWLLLVEAGTTAWYRVHEKNLVPGRPWTVQWPETMPGFRELPIDEHTRETLRYDAGRQATWQVLPGGSAESRPAPGVDHGQAFLFFFRWEPGTATVLRARAHRPDICLPAVGWRPTGAPDLRSYPATDQFALPFQHFSFVHEAPGSRPLYAETFFCLREDRVRAGADETKLQFSNWSIPERWEVVRRGLRNPGQQVLEYVLLTRHPLGKAAVEEEFARLVPRLVALKN